MELLFILSMQNLELAKEEVLALAHTREYKRFANLLIADCRPFDFQRLAYTKKVLQAIFVSDEKSYELVAGKINWERYYKGSFCVRAHNSDKQEADLAGLIWGKLNKPKVNLDKPKSQFEFYFADGKVVCGLLLDELRFEDSKKKMEGNIALKPRYARAIVNLANAKKGGILLDPFCGTGGLLVEGARLGCRVIGSDINLKLLAIAKKNMGRFKVKDYVLLNEDATKIAEKIRKKVDAIVCDLPYGRRSSLHRKGLKKLVQELLNNAVKILRQGSRLIMVLPYSPNADAIAGFQMVAVIKDPVHGSLTRYIVVLEKA